MNREWRPISVHVESSGFIRGEEVKVHIRNLNIIVVPVHHPVGSAAVIQAVPVVIQVVSVPVAVSAADGDNVNMPAIPAAISSAFMKTVLDSVPETMKS